MTAYDGEILGLSARAARQSPRCARRFWDFITTIPGTVKMDDNLRPQMVFQDPFSSLNPARKIGWILEEPAAPSRHYGQGQAQADGCGHACRCRPRPVICGQEAEGAVRRPETENQHWNSAFDGFQADHCGRAGIGPGCHGSVSDFKG